jgi:poly-D-alanine transfer protein DltD
MAALLAIGITVGVGVGIRLEARRLASRDLRLVSTAPVPFKYQTLTFQRAALESGHELLLFGSSELYTRGGAPYRATQLFASEPTGFGTVAVGRAGTADLFFMETLAALGHDLRDRQIVISDSPPWFYSPHGPSPAEHVGNFLPEVAYAFVFDAPISQRLRRAGARRMLAHAYTLRDQPLLSMAIEDLAQPTTLRRIEYAALTPLGELATHLLRVRDAIRTVMFVWRQRNVLSDEPHPQPLPWPDLAMRATAIAEQRDTTNPFGFPDFIYAQLRDENAIRRALAVYESGTSNRDGQLLPPPTTWLTNMSRSDEWKDLRLVLRALRELHARPLVWSLPLPGAYDDFTRRSALARRRYYERWERTVERAKVPWLDFRDCDEDRYFLVDPGSHLSPRGWIFADRALDGFWHRQSVDEVRAALATLAEQVPAPPVPTRVGTEETVARQMGDPG